MTDFYRCWISERAKNRRTLTIWLILVGGFFTPSIIFLWQLRRYQKLPTVYLSDDYWLVAWRLHWESMTVILFPVGIILACALLAQLEVKNNTWKQLLSTPLSLSSIFFAKLGIVHVMLLQVFLLFNFAMFLFAILPTIIFSDVPFPTASYSTKSLLEFNLRYYVDCLPMIAIQQLLSLHFKNFLVPVGAGLLIWLIGVAGATASFSYVFPYFICGLDFLIDIKDKRYPSVPVNLQWISLGYFFLFTTINYCLFVFKSDKS